METPTFFCHAASHRLSPPYSNQHYSYQRLFIRLTPFATIEIQHLSPFTLQFAYLAFSLYFHVLPEARLPRNGSENLAGRPYERRVCLATGIAVSWPVLSLGRLPDAPRWVTISAALGQTGCEPWWGSFSGLARPGNKNQNKTESGRKEAEALSGNVRLATIYQRQLFPNLLFPIFSWSCPGLEKEKWDAKGARYAAGIIPGDRNHHLTTSSFYIVDVFVCFLSIESSAFGVFRPVVSGVGSLPLAMASFATCWFFRTRSRGFCGKVLQFNRWFKTDAWTQKRKERVVHGIKTNVRRRLVFLLNGALRAGGFGFAGSNINNKIENIAGERGTRSGCCKTGQCRTV